MILHLAIDGAAESSLGVGVDIVSAAARLVAAGLAEAPARKSTLEQRVVSLDGQPVRSGSGRSIAVDGALVLSELSRSDVLVLPGVFAATPRAIEELLDRKDITHATTLLAGAAARGVLLAASCSATFLLAQAGILDGQRATTTWWLAPAFARRFPAIALDADRMVLEADGVLTAGSALAHADLMLAILARIGSPTLARLVARYLLLDERTSQTRYMILDHLRVADPAVEAAERYATAHVDRQVSLAELARAAAVSPRTLARRVHAALGMTPLELTQRVRMARAAHLLETTSAPVDEVAGLVVTQTQRRSGACTGATQVNRRADDAVPGPSEPTTHLQPHGKIGPNIVSPATLRNGWLFGTMAAMNKPPQKQPSFPSTLQAQPSPADDPLTDFDRRAITLDDVTRTVYVAGEGPAVIVMAEMPGISPHVARFARWTRDAGFAVYLPSLFGRDGAYPEAEAGLAVLKRACVSAEFAAFAANASSPVTQWLRGLARLAHNERGGPGVGAIGMCFTGNFALSMMLEASVVAPVLCQPSLPINDPAALQIAPEELVAVRQRLEHEDLTVRAYRFEGDVHCPAQRFAAYASALGPRFEATVLPNSAANPTPPPFFAQVVGCPHSVVTAHLIDEAGQPTVAARDEILAFFAARLLPAPTAPQETP